MKDTLTDANFPRTADLRVYHLGLRPGEVANRIVTVGSPSRARTIASFFDANPKPFQLESERGFLTITGRYQGVPVSVMSIGMGNANMDFFVREVRECLGGDMYIVRLGSCGCLIDAPVGTVVVPKACVAISRNVDFDFINPEQCDEPAYRISKPVLGDPEFHMQIKKSLEAARPADSNTVVLSDVVNASADSFYSSQGRQTSFPDANEHLIQQLLDTVQDLATLEMETHHLYHLAACWGRRNTEKTAQPPPLAAGPVNPSSDDKPASQPASIAHLAAPDTFIKASAAQMVFAARTSRDFITPEQVLKLEHWTGKAILDALKEMDIQPERHHPEQGSVWEM
ncbi:purine and uridine phosphorylase [Dendrothele bispora CBS 962.96]|uniref:Purine and uridine phosphorylase n=1 Tax=Dendrothele bispora (strain CBS 962.96) TaxID=1314807 RepID=A0A4S8M8M9_DENBC|nr:purine and uridine phosphorylase [Dendrothele bispora CBS 962.96]